jgi:hypothetical protein
MLGKCLAAVAIGSAMLLTTAGLAQPVTTTNQSALPLRPFGDFRASPAITQNSRTVGDAIDKRPYQAAAAQAAQTQAALRSFKTDSMDDFIPDGAVPLLTSLKHQLRDVVLNVLNTGSPERVSPEMVQAMALSNLSSQGAKVELPDCEGVVQPTDEHEYAYGDIYEVTVRQPTSDPDLLVITTTLGVCCGDDTSLYLVRRQGQRWAIVIAEEADGYTEVSGAAGYFQYYVAEPDTEGLFYLVTAHVTPWCTSNWQELRYQVERPGLEPSHPNVILTGRESVFLGDETAFALSGGPYGFSLKFRGEHSLDSGIMIRDHIMKYQTEGNQLTRISPVATSVEDFLDEWINMPWQDAVRWSDQSNSADLARWHAFLHDKKCWSTDGLSFVQPCEVTGSGRAKADCGEWRIGLELSSKDAGSAAFEGDSSEPKGAAAAAEPCLRVPPTLFFTVTRDARGFIMKDVGPVRPPGCPGETPPEVYSRQ